MLADFLRYDAGLTGTKIVCAEGDCGACTVLRWFPGAKGRAEFLPMNSCIATVAQLDGSSIVTVDALAAPDLTPVQQAMMKAHGSQCGFCTPGFVMALTGLVERKKCAGEKSITARDAKNALTGNLCRCTGYEPIIAAATGLKPATCESINERFFFIEQERDLRKTVAEPLHLKSEVFEFFAPTKLQDAAAYFARHRGARVLASATDLGVFHNKWRSRLTHILSLHLIPALSELKFLKGGRVSVGARVTLSALREALKEREPEFARFLDLFASPQIKNVATLIGNVANASPIADTPPFLLVSNAIIEVHGRSGKRSIAIEDFFKGYRKTALRAGEFITSITFALRSKSQTLSLRKVSERKDLDISAVNAAVWIDWADVKRRKIREARIAYGGVAATPLRLRKTEAVFKGRSPDAGLVDEAIEILQGEISPIGDVRGSAAFRRVLAENLLRGVFAGDVK